MEQVKRREGRPYKWNSVNEIQHLIDNYFLDCDALNKPYTITGLCLALDCDMETIRNYKEKDEFSSSLKKAYMKCQNYAENHMFTAKNPAGSIFALKNYGWTDKQEINANITNTTVICPPLGDIDKD